MSSPEEKKTPTSHLKPYQFTTEKAREAAKKSHEARRAKRDQLAAGPREAIAMGLMDKLDALRLGAALLAEDTASTDAKVRNQARRDIGAWLNQGLGTVERRTADDGSTPEGQLPADREARARLMAELEARIAVDTPTED